MTTHFQDEHRVRCADCGTKMVFVDVKETRDCLYELLRRDDGTVFASYIEHKEPLGHMHILRPSNVPYCAECGAEDKETGWEMTDQQGLEVQEVSSNEYKPMPTM